MAEGEEVFTPNRFNILHRRMKMKREGKGLPKEILNMDEDSIKLYKKALQDGKVSVYNIRVMVVGHYGVGKTTLTKRLFGEQVDITKRASTEGIDVHVDRCKISLKDGTWISKNPDERRKQIFHQLAKLFKKDDQEVTQLKPSKEMNVMPVIGDTLHESAKPEEQTSSQTGSRLDVDKVQEQKTTVEYPEDRTKTESKHSKIQTVIKESAEIMDFHPQSTSDSEESVVESVDEEYAQNLRHLQKFIAESGQDDKVHGQTGELSIWDFAGQEVYYSTHQVFLSRRAIYLLVVDMSKELGDVIEEEEDASNIDCKGGPKDKSADEEVTESADHRELDKFKTYITKAFTKLVDYMFPVPILDCFVEDDTFFRYRETRDIKDEITTSEKNRKILEKVRSKGKCCYDNFKKCLKKTNQKLLFELLECIEKGEDTSVLEKKLDEAFKTTSKGNKDTNPKLQAPEDINQHTKEETNRKTVSDFIDFWLNSIHEFGSYESDKKPPVILIGTFADKLKKRNDSKSYPEDRLFSLREVLAEKAVSCHLTTEDFPVDNTVDDENIPALKQYIFKVASSQKDSWGMEIPAKWITLEDILIGLKEQNLKVLHKDELRKLNGTLPVPIGSDEELELFLKFHHDIGSYLYFSEDTLKDYILLEPQWLIDALKSIINAKRFCIRQADIKHEWPVFERTAVLKPVIIDAVWGNDENREKFMPHKKLLLSYMEKLGLVAKPIAEDNSSKEAKNYIVPYMLKTTVPKDRISYCNSGTRKSTSILCYTTAQKSEKRFLPLLIFNKFLCMCMQRWELHKANKENEIFCDGAIFKVNDEHLLYIFFREQVIQIWITRVNEDEEEPSFSLCTETKTEIEKILKTNCRMDNRLLLFVKCSNADLYSTEEKIMFKLEENRNSTKKCPCLCKKEKGEKDHFVLTSCWPYVPKDSDKYKALYPYTSTEEHHRTIQEGDIVTVLKCFENGWCWIEMNEQCGYVPTDYLEKVMK